VAVLQLNDGAGKFQKFPVQRPIAHLPGSRRPSIVSLGLRVTR
jgi:hypothetical protein